MEGKMIPYNEFKYLWPPRPRNAILPAMIQFYENRRWTAQVKKNGSCALWAVSPDKQFIVMNRHGAPFTNWTPNPDLYKELRELPNKWQVFTGELLHHKTPNIKDVFYIFDILVKDGEFLKGSKFHERANILTEMFNHPSFEEDHSYKISNKLWLAKNYNIGFNNLYENLTDISDEGLVLKDSNAILGTCFRPDDNSNWMVKIRKPHKNYGF